MKQSVPFRQKALSAAKTAGQLALVAGVAVPIIATAGGVLALDAASRYAVKSIRRRLRERRNASLTRRIVR